MTVRLKIKIKSLAAEAAIIRKEERKELGWRRRKNDPSRATYQSLRNHRVDTVRRTARYSLLAYGFLRGREYLRMEKTCREPVFWPAVWKEIERFLPPNADKAATKIAFDAWVPSS